MTTITLLIRLHGGEERIFIIFSDNNKTINDAVRKVPSVKWSETTKQWHLPVEKSAVKVLKQKIQSIAQLDTRILKKQLQERKQNPPTAATLPLTKYSSGYPVKRSANIRKIPPVNAHILPLMKQHLKLKASSSSTISTYLNEMSQLLQASGDIPADDLQPVHLKRYLVYCLDKLGLKENTLHSRINAMKFYYEQILGKDRFFWQIPRPSKDLLGHFNIKTTERYLHVSKKQLINIVSPFDDLWKNEQIEW